MSTQHRREHPLWMRAITRALARASRALYAGPLGEQIRARLDADRGLTQVEIRLRRGHADLDGLSIAFLSDLHAGHYMDARDLERIAERVAAVEPDLVCLGGDLADRFPGEFELLTGALRVLDAPLGVVAVPGNHDHYADPGLRRWHEVLGGAGVTLLRNRGFRVKRGAATLWIGGIDDLSRGRPDIDAALLERTADEPALLLSHQPDVLPRAASRGVDLVLAGHTHGGQVRPFGYPPPLRETRLGLWSGHHESGVTQLYVGRGVGVSMLPLRWNAPAEIPVVTLRVGRPRG